MDLEEPSGPRQNNRPEGDRCQAMTLRGAPCEHAQHQGPYCRTHGCAHEGCTARALSRNEGGFVSRGPGAGYGYYCADHVGIARAEVAARSTGVGLIDRSAAALKSQGVDALSSAEDGESMERLREWHLMVNAQGEIVAAETGTNFYGRVGLEIVETLGIYVLPPEIHRAVWRDARDVQKAGPSGTTAGIESLLAESLERIGKNYRASP